MDKSTNGWIEVTNKKKTKSKKNVQRPIKKANKKPYIPPPMGDKKTTPSLKDRSEQALQNFNNPEKYVHKYLKAGIFYNKNNIDIIEADLFNYDKKHKQLSKNYNLAIKNLQTLNSKFEIKNISIIIKELNFIEKCIETIKNDIPQNLWSDKFYRGNIYNKNGDLINEITPELKKLSIEYVNKQDLLNNTQKPISKPSKSIGRKVEKGLSFKELLLSNKK